VSSGSACMRACDVRVHSDHCATTAQLGTSRQPMTAAHKNNLNSAAMLALPPNGNHWSPAAVDKRTPYTPDTHIDWRLVAMTRMMHYTLPLRACGGLATEEERLNSSLSSRNCFAGHPPRSEQTCADFCVGCARG